MDLGVDWIGRYGYLAIFVLLLLGIVGLPVPDETLLLFAGYLSFKGELRLGPALATALLGSACGISLSYAIGRFVGPYALVRVVSRIHVTPERLALTSRWVERWGRYVLLGAYFIPGVRHLAALIFGASLLPLSVFVRFAYTGALLWSSTFIGLGYATGEEWRHLSFAFHRTVVLIATLIVLTIAIILIVVRRRTRLH